MTEPALDARARVTFVIPTYDRRDALDETLTRLGRLDHPKDLVEVIVVDDGGSQDLGPVIKCHRDELDDLRLIRQENRGAAAARNRGAADASGDLLIFLDDDILVEPDHVARHLDAQARFGPCFVNGFWKFAEATARKMKTTPFGRYRMELEQWMVGPWLITAIDEHTGEMPSLTSANLSVPTTIFRSLGGFDEDFPEVGHEDIELALRAGAAGHRMIMKYDIEVWHNDQRDTHREFCERQRQSARGAAVLAAKDPAWAIDRAFIVQALPISREDGPVLIAKKSVKQALSTTAALAALHASIALVERVPPLRRALPRLYWSVAGLYIFRGVREGMARDPGVPGALRAAQRAG